MNKKALLIISAIPALLLCGCTKKNKVPYVYPDGGTEFNIDYSNNPELKEQLKQIHFEDGGEVSRATLSQFLGVISLNDNYANRLTLKESSSKYYVDSSENPVDGDYIYSKTSIIARDNATHSLSGTISIKDEKWSKNATDPAVLDHKDVETTGTYSLAPDTKTEIGKEIINCDNDAYDEENTIGFSEKVWSKKMNLSQTSTFGEQVKNTLNDIDKANESLAHSYQYQTNIISSKDADSLTIRINSSSTQPVNETGKKLIISYAISVVVMSDMVTNTKYQYTIVEVDTNDTEYVVLSEYSERQLSHQN